MLLVRPLYYVWSFKSDVQKYKRDSVYYIWSMKEYYRKKIMFAISTEGITSQEISTLQQYKYRLDRRLTMRAVWCRECIFKAGYEISITTDLKTRRNSVQSMLKSLEAEMYVN